MKILKKFPIVAVALAIMASAINMFLAPHHIAAGGVSGIGVLLESAVGIDRAIVVLVLNAAMLVLAFLFLGRPAFIKSVIGSLLLPLALAVVPEVMALEDRFLSVIVGSVLFAVAVAILYRIEASSGGTTIPPLILQKKTGLNTSIGLLMTDMVVVFFNIFVFGFESFVLAVISLVITSMVMTYIETGIKRNKAVMISGTAKAEEIREALTKTIRSKTSVMETIDAVSGSRETLLFAMIDNKDYPALIRLVDQLDEGAVIAAFNVAETHGQEVLQRRKKCEEICEKT